MDETTRRILAYSGVRLDEKARISLERCLSPDGHSSPELRALLKAYPDIYRGLGNLAIRAEIAWVELIVKENLSTRELVYYKLRELKVQLHGPTPSALERLLVERVIVCWLQVHHYELLAARNAAEEMGLDDSNQKQVDRAHKRFLAAIRALATVRKLLRSVRPRAKT